MSEQTAKKQKRAFKQPHVFTILCILIAVIALLSFVAPTGVYDTYITESGASQIDVNSYHAVERNPVTFEYMLTLVPRGFISNITLIVFVLFCLGMFNIVGQTKAVDAMVSQLLVKLHRHIGPCRCSACDRRRPSRQTPYGCR